MTEVGLAGRMGPLVAAYCRRPAVRHELGLDANTIPTAELLDEDVHSLTFRLQAPPRRRWVARLTTGSALGLSSSKQIAYEAQLLRRLEPLRLAPQLCYVDATLYQLPYGFLVREYVEGKPLASWSGARLQVAARLLAQLHSLPVPPDTELIRDDRPLTTLIDEAAALLGGHISSRGPVPPFVDILSRALSAARSALAAEPAFRPVSVVHGNLSRGSWVLASPPGSPIALAGLEAVGGGEQRLCLVGWSRAVLADPTADLCALLVSAGLAGGESFPSTGQAVLLGAYLRARPELDETAFRARLVLRLRLVALRDLCRSAVSHLQFVADASARMPDPETLPGGATDLSPDRLHAVLGDWTQP